MRRVINGTIPTQLLNLAGGGMGQLAAIGGGAYMGGPTGAIAGMAIAGGSRKASEALTRRNAELVRALIAAGGMKEAPKMSPAVKTILDALGLAAVPRSANDLQSQTAR